MKGRPKATLVLTLNEREQADVVFRQGHRFTDGHLQHWGARVSPRILARR